MLLLISLVRAIVEMLGLCLLGQMFLHLIAGRGREHNLIYRGLSLVTRAPRQMVAFLLPWRASGAVVAALTLIILLMLWLGLAYLRNKV